MTALQIKEAGNLDVFDARFRCPDCRATLRLNYGVASCPKCLTTGDPGFWSGLIAKARRGVVLAERSPYPLMDVEGRLVVPRAAK